MNSHAMDSYYSVLVINYRFDHDRGWSDRCNLEQRYSVKVLL